MRLYCVSREVETSPGHPLDRELEHGFLLLWLFAESPENALMRADAIIGQLQYTVGNEAGVSLATSSPDPKIEAKLDEARKIGLAMLLIATPLGASLPNDLDFS